MFGLYVKFTARPEECDTLVARLLGTAKLIEGIAGCQLYVINTSPTEADIVWVTEIWRSQADHDASLTVEGAQEAIQRTIPLLAARPEPISVIPVGGKGLAVVANDSSDTP